MIEPLELELPDTSEASGGASGSPDWAAEEGSDDGDPCKRDRCDRA